MKKRILLLVVVAFLMQGCALLFSGRHDKITVKGSNPPNARVYYNGQLVGTGNCRVKIHKKSINNCVVEVKAPGYESQQFRFRRKIKVGAILLDCCTGFIWLVGDFASGAIYKAKPQVIHYDLIPLTPIQNTITPSNNK